MSWGGARKGSGRKEGIGNNNSEVKQKLNVTLMVTRAEKEKIETQIKATMEELKCNKSAAVYYLLTKEKRD